MPTCFNVNSKQIKKDKTKQSPPNEYCVYYYMSLVHIQGGLPLLSYIRWLVVPQSLVLRNIQFSGLKNDQRSSRSRLEDVWFDLGFHCAYIV